MLLLCPALVLSAALHCHPGAPMLRPAAGVGGPVRTPAHIVLAAQPQNQKGVTFQPGLVNRLKGLFSRKKAEPVCFETKYGCDPRGNDKFAKQLSEAPVREPADYELAKPGVVGELSGGVGHLTALLKDAGTERAVVLKFKREGCPACGSTVEPLASAAVAYAGRADFMEVDYAKERPFCKGCALAVVPCAHIYVDGKLVESLPLGPRAWSKFASRLESIVGEPGGEVLAAIIPEDKNLPDARAVTGLDQYL